MANSHEDVEQFVEEFYPDSECERLIRLLNIVTQEVLVVIGGENNVLVFTLIGLFVHLLLEHLFPRQPKFFGVLGFNKLIQRVFNLCLPEIRECSSDHNKKDDAHGEDIGTLSSIVLFLENFRRLVLACANLGVVDAQAILSLLVGGEAEVCHFQIVPGVQQDVLRLEVAMDNP
jgi:hypothetical protein